VTFPALLTAEDVHKRYGGVHALRGASLDVRRSEIHGLVGQNGSGKSTLLGIVSGQLAPDSGRLAISGEEARFGSPGEAIAAGIATVTQETTLVPELTVAENILLGRKAVRRWTGIDWRATVRRARGLLEQLELDIDPRAVVSRLGPDLRQMVEIARALSFDARVLILDEPTSSLTDDQVDALFATVRRLRDRGVSTIFVSHRMRDVFGLVDRVTVLRDGRTVACGPIGELDPDRVIELMVGRRPEALEAAREAPASTERPLLSARGLSVPGRVTDASLDVCAGEIVGLAGLVGAGRSELLGALFGLEPLATGRIELDGRPVLSRTPREAVARGLAYVPAERKHDGLILDMTVAENLMMARTSMVARARLPRRRSEAGTVRELFGQLGIRGCEDGSAVSALSGGNQQKVLLGKWLGTSPRVLLMDEPTRGVDVGAKADIYRLLRSARDAGLAMLVSSSETSELRLLCDRILVMFRGRIVASMPRDDATDGRIAHYAMGHS
jgi:ABC-type sugar transport system ATPase subunit